jgi:exodeoxyribonuclease V gamma subunit
MTLSIFSANRVEILQQKLGEDLFEQPLANPLSREIIIVPTYAMARWLNLKLAQQLGVAANIDYPSPSGWVWQLLHQFNNGLTKADPYSREPLQWALFERIPCLLSLPKLGDLRSYLGTDIDEVRLWQLSGQLSGLLEKYQLYRPEWIRQWKNPADQEDWISILWRELCQHNNQPHQVDLIDGLMGELRAPQQPGLLPQRISLFGLSSLPAIYINLLNQLGNHIDVNLYQHSPTRHYWADLVSKKTIAHRRLNQPDEDQYFESGNDLLSSWGRQGQALQDLLLDQSGELISEPVVFLPPGDQSLLNRIQQTIYDLEAETCAIEVDQSIQINICHSPMRECQVLHNHLISVLDQNTDFMPEDILVMIPDISTYAPTIEAVFHPQNSQRPFVPWNISDITLAEEHPLILSFLQLVLLPESRFSVTDIRALLDVDSICTQFELDDASHESILSFITDSQVRWGIDAEHRASLGLPATQDNTWHQARDRLMSGYALGQVGLWRDIAPLDNIDTDKAEQFSRFWQFFEKLIEWRTRLSQPTERSHWQQRLHQLIDDFFFESPQSADSLQVIRKIISELDTGSNTPVSCALISHWLTQNLTARESPGRLFSGGVTFCGMRPMRSLPFKVVCLLGMNDGSFPGRDPQSSFDKMGDQWRPGDPLRRDEDRYLMLETLLCAREQLYISYCGRSILDNSVKQPSVLISELTDFIDHHFYSNDSKEPLSQIITEHRSMQAFAVSEFDAGRQSYDPLWFDLAKRVSGQSKSNLVDHKLPDIEFDQCGEITIEQLANFLSHPIKGYYEHQLGIRFRETDTFEDVETFALEGLDAWRVKQQLITDQLADQQTSFDQWRAEALLPVGSAAEFEMASIQQKLDPLFKELSVFTQVQPERFYGEINLPGPWQLRTVIQSYYSGKGFLQITASKIKAKHILSFWLNHLLLSAVEHYQNGEIGLLLTLNEKCSLEPVGKDEAIERLNQYVELYCQGHTQLIWIFPQSSLSWAKSNGDEKKTRGSWSSDQKFGDGGDIADPYIEVSIRNRQEQHSWQFEHFDFMSHQLYKRFLELVKTSKLDA